MAIDYVSKWIEAIPCRNNNQKTVIRFLKENILSRFGIPRVIISDGGTHFCNKILLGIVPCKALFVLVFYEINKSIVFITFSNLCISLMYE